ncbi:hypothetical protein [Intrasporangium mesophilum]
MTSTTKTTSPASTEPDDQDAAAPAGVLSYGMRVAIPGVLIAFGAVKVLQSISDPDTFWHIRAGELLSGSWDFVINDPYSASSQLPWIFNQWLPQLLMFQAYDHFGLPGVAWLRSLAAVAIFATLWWVCRRRSGLLITSILLALTTVGMAGSLSPRPQVVSFAFAMVTTSAWMDTIADKKPRWWLIAISWVWACSHGLWFVGAVIGGVVLVGMLVARLLSVREAARLALIPVLSVVVAMATPVGPRLLLSPFQVHDVTQYITEWQPPEATYLPLLVVLVMLLPLIVAVARKPSRQSVPLVLLALLVLFFAITYARTVAIAAAIAAPMAAAALQAVVPIPAERMTRREVITTASLACVGLVLAAVMAPFVAAKPGLGPNALDKDIAALPQGTVVCNVWEYGGWLILQHPNVKVTQDPRAELYTQAHIRHYLDFINALPGWEKYPAENGCTYALVDNDLAVTNNLRAQLGWTVVADRGGTSLLRAPASS